MVSQELAAQYRFEMSVEGMREPTRQRCFNQGSDGRLAGDSIEQCPYAPGSPAWSAWCEGWNHCDRFWCVDEVSPKPKRKVRS